MIILMIMLPTFHRFKRPDLLLRGPSPFFGLENYEFCAVPSQMGYGESQMLDKLLYEEEVRRSILTYEQQFHYGVFYAYMKLREQEIRNIMWIAECVSQDQKGRIHDGIVFLT